MKILQDESGVETTRHGLHHEVGADSTLAGEGVQVDGSRGTAFGRGGVPLVDPWGAAHSLPTSKDEASFLREEHEGMGRRWGAGDSGKDGIKRA